MFGKRWRVFRLADIPIYVDASWLIIVALLTLSLARLFPDLITEYYPAATETFPPWAYWVTALLASVVFFGCLLLHELGHAVVGRAQRIPIRGITLFLFGGVAELGDEPPSAKSEFLMAIAGPAVSVALALALGLAAWAGSVLGWSPLAVVPLAYLAGINGIVVAFNMVPAFPLDGGRVLRSILWGATGRLRQSTYWSSLVGRGFAWVLIGVGVLNFVSGNWLGGIWLGLVGLFLNNSAQAGYAQVLLRQTLSGEPVGRFMNPNPITVPPTVNLREWLEEYVYRHHRKTFPVVRDGRLEGYVDTQALAAVPREEWDRCTVGEVMHRNLTGMTAGPDTDALEAVRKMVRNNLSRLLIVEGENLRGVVGLKDLMQYTDLMLELEGERRDTTRN